MARYVPYIASLTTIAICFLVSWLLDTNGLSIANVIMFFVLAVAFVAARWGTGPSIVASVVSALTLAFFFLPPLMSLAVSDFQHVIMLAVMIVVALLISKLTDQVRAQAAAAQSHAERAESLNHLSAALVECADVDALAIVAAKQVRETFGGETAVFLSSATGFQVLRNPPVSTAPTADELSLVHAALASTQSRLQLASSPNDAGAVVLPLMAGTNALGALLLQLGHERPELSSDQQQLLRTMVHQIAGAIERDRLSHQVHKVQVEAEAERLRSALLSSVTHDLRTPLAIITGASSSLVESNLQMPTAVQRDLCLTIFEYSNRMTRLIDNLLNITRIESGLVSVNKQWHVLEEVIGSALSQMAPIWGQRPVTTKVPDHLPLVPLDDVLFQQVLINLFENVQRYTPPDSPITIEARVDGDRLTLEVADCGPGLPVGTESRVFEKFFRGQQDHSKYAGTGLGLTICRAIVAAHRGEIVAENRPEGGALIRIHLPMTVDKKAPLEPLPAVAQV